MTAQFVSSPGKTIAIFDFDHTLIEGESFWAFLGMVVGWPRTAFALFEAFVMYGFYRAKDKHDPDIADMRTFLKTHLLIRLLRGKSTARLSAAAEKLSAWMKWKTSVHQALLDHHAAGHHVVIASGGLDLYLPELLADLPHDGLICTHVGVRDGHVTGDMISGNCVRKRKAELVATYIAQHGPFAESWGYGNLPHDLPMLKLLKHRVVV